MLFCFNILKTHFSKLIHLLLLKNQRPNYFYGINYNHFIFQQNEKRMIQELKADVYKRQEYVAAMPSKSV